MKCLCKVITKHLECCLSLWVTGCNHHMEGLLKVERGKDKGIGRAHLSSHRIVNDIWIYLLKLESHSLFHGKICTFAKRAVLTGCHLKSSNCDFFLVNISIFRNGFSKIYVECNCSRVQNHNTYRKSWYRHKSICFHLPYNNWDSNFVEEILVKDDKMRSELEVKECTGFYITFCKKT